jgi:hypothetical protein
MASFSNTSIILSPSSRPSCVSSSAVSQENLTLSVVPNELNNRPYHHHASSTSLVSSRSARPQPLRVVSQNVVLSKKFSTSKTGASEYAELGDDVDALEEMPSPDLSWINDIPLSAPPTKWQRSGDPLNESMVSIDLGSKLTAESRYLVQKEAYL